MAIYDDTTAQADSWDGKLLQQQEELAEQQDQQRNAELAQRINANRGVYDGYAQMGRALSERQSQFIGDANAHITSALRLAAENGGRLPQYALQGLSAALGLDGQNATVYGGGFDKKGGFMLAVARKNPQTGQMSHTSMSFTPQQQYSLMLATPGVFSRQEVDGMRRQLIDTYHLHPNNVPEVPQGWGETGDVGVGNRTASGGTVVPSSWLYGPQRRAAISAFGADGRGGFSRYTSDESTDFQLQTEDFGTRAADDAGRWQVQSIGPDSDDVRRDEDGNVVSNPNPRQIRRYKNDKTGEVASVRDGETPPWERASVGERERIARMREQGLSERAANSDKTKRDLAEAANLLKRYGIDVSADLRNRGLDLKGQKIANATSGRQFSKDQIASMREWLENNGPQVDGEDNPNFDRDLYARRKAQYDAAIWGDETDVPKDGGGQPPPTSERIREVLKSRGIDPATWRRAQGDVKPKKTAKSGGAPVATPSGTDIVRQMRSDGGKSSGTRERTGSASAKSLGRYDTRLTPEEETRYQEWRRTLPTPLQYEGDYDLRGYWKDPETQKSGITDGQHFTDKYKKPNHETFSVESKYAVGEDAKKAGRWKNGKYVPAASGNNLNSVQRNRSNVVDRASVKLPSSDLNLDQEPILPEERRKRILNSLKEWQESQRQAGNEISDEDIEKLVDAEMSRIVGEKKGR